MQHCEYNELDSIMMILENPIRRKIIKRLSQEASYPLQIAKELGLGQQLIAKHLDIMEEAGVVTSSMLASPQGPKRKIYILNKSISLTVDLAPHLFSTQILSLNALLEKEQISEVSSYLIKRINEIKESLEERSRVSSFEALIAEIDSMLGKIENERSNLLYIRNSAMKEASKMIKKMESTQDTKRVLYYFLNEHSAKIEDLSKSLNLREAEVRQILSELKKDMITA